MSKIRNLTILQARMSSSRLPGKVLKVINCRPMIEWQISRIQQSLARDIVLATSVDKSDDELAKIVNALGVEVFRGSLTDVHSRFIQIINFYKPEYFLRLTGDCPLVMPHLLNEMLSKFEVEKLDYLSNINPPTYPDGLDVEIISTEAFLEFSAEPLSREEREHVTLGLRRRPGMRRHGNFVNNTNLSKMRWTVDYPEDFIFVKDVFKFFKGRELEFNIDDILQAIKIGDIQDNLKPYSFRNINLINTRKFD